MKVQPTYDLKTDADLIKFLLGAIRDVRKDELELEKASVISKLADKYTKNELILPVTPILLLCLIWCVERSFLVLVLMFLAWIYSR